MKTLLCLAFLIVSQGFAQEAKPAKHFRFIPLGELPPHKEVIRNGVRIHLPHPPGSVPPKPTTLAIDAKEGLPLGLRLKEFTKLYSIKPTAGGVRLYEGKVIGAKPWITSRFPAKSHSLGILYQDSKKMSWFNPVMKVVPDDLASFPLGTVRFVNVSQYSALVRVAKNKTDVIKPGGILIKKLPMGNSAMLIGYKLPGKNGAMVPVFTNNFNLKGKQRIQAFLFKAKGKDPRKAVKMFYRSEFFTPPPKPKRAGAVAGG